MCCDVGGTYDEPGELFRRRRVQDVRSEAQNRTDRDGLSERDAVEREEEDVATRVQHRIGEAELCGNW